MFYTVNFLFICIFSGSFFPCVPNKKIRYLQKKEEIVPLSDGKVITYEMLNYRLQHNDIIDVIIKIVEDFLKVGFSVLGEQSTQNQMVGQVAKSGGGVCYMIGNDFDRESFARFPMIAGVDVVDNLFSNELCSVKNFGFKSWYFWNYLKVNS
jgi:polysaccharide export outer membrane protein